MSITIPRVAQYARFSSDNQRSESIDAQIRAMNQFCKQNHWQIVAVYSDEARSATTDNRPQFQQMISDSSKELFDIVLVHKLDRFSRDRYDSAIYKKKLKKNHVRSCSVLERMDDSPESIMMESVLEGMAEYYSKNLGREVMKGMKETALQCKHTGGCPPLGYDVDENRHLIINEHEAEAVRIIFEMFAEGYGYTAIIKHLNEHGYEPKRGGIFGKNSLFSILANEKYTGVFVFNKSTPKDGDGKRNGHTTKSPDQIIRIENGCPAIISKELFHKVQKRRMANKRNTGHYHEKVFYLLTSKVFCGVCGKHIQGNVRYSGRSKLRLATYRCATLRKFCNNKENNKDYLDAYVVELLRTEIFNSKKLHKRIDAVNAHVERYNAQYEILFAKVNRQLEEVNQNLANITAAVEKGIITQTLVDRVEEPAVKKMFEMYASGMSYNKIIEWLDNNGYKTTRGESFGMTSIKSILENEKYCGVYFWNKRAGKDFRGVRNNHKLKEDYYRVPDAVPAIVSEELFSKVQDRLRDNKNKIRNHNGKNFYPMNGKIFCEKCGKPLKGKVQYSRTNKNNEPVKQYRFSYDCHTVKTVNEKYLDDMIIYGLRECIFSPANTDQLLQRLNEYSDTQNEEIDLQIRLLEAEKADIDKRRKNLIAVIEKGNSIDSIVEQIKEMEEQIDKINSRIGKYEASKKTFTLDDLKFIKSKFTDYVREECNEDVITFLDDTIDKIQVDDVIDVKLRKNIKIDSDTKKIFK